MGSMTLKDGRPKGESSSICCRDWASHAWRQWPNNDTRSATAFPLIWEAVLSSAPADPTDDSDFDLLYILRSHPRLSSCKNYLLHQRSLNLRVSVVPVHAVPSNPLLCRCAWRLAGRAGNTVTTRSSGASGAAGSLVRHRGFGMPL
jgi:hypothetical protein